MTTLKTRTKAPFAIVAYYVKGGPTIVGYAYAEPAAKVRARKLTVKGGFHTRHEALPVAHGKVEVA